MTRFTGKPLRVHYLQHVPFEGLGSIETWLQQRRHYTSATRLFKGDQLPRVDHLDWIIVMGGPMAVSGVNSLADEFLFIFFHHTVGQHNVAGVGEHRLS